jgi:molecular chaperone GrpE
MATDPKAPEIVEPEASGAAEQPQTPEAADFAPAPAPAPAPASESALAPESAPAPAPASAPAPESALAPESAPASESALAPESAPAPAPGGNHHSVEADVEELAARAGKADEYLELAQRTKADFENYRKRALRDAAAAQDRGVVKLARELLPAVDNLDRALEAAQAASGDDADPAENGSSPLVSGVKLVHADVIAALARVGIERFSPEGERFDPEYHEAVAQLPVEGVQPGTIVEVYQRGYRLGDSILRPARVVVAK